MQPRAYYNEIDPFAAEWLRYLIAFGHIANGDVDERSIEDIHPSDLKGYTQCHFFAGIGGWSHALRLAGWSDTRPCWTGSCPCQPFSAAGKGKGLADERHLWPAFHWLIASCRPIEIFGEQVASPDGLAWLDIVQSDLERTAYASGAIDICAAGIGAPHIRQRLYWGAYSTYSNGRSRISATETGIGTVGERRGRLASNGVACNSSHSSSRITSDGNIQRSGEHGLQPQTGGISNSTIRRFSMCGSTPGRAGYSPQSNKAGNSDNPLITGLEGLAGDEQRPGWLSRWETRSIAAAGATRGFWSPADWWYGRDGKYRPIEPGLFPLAHGISGRVGKLRGYGNAIIPELAAEFIKAWQEIT